MTLPLDTRLDRARLSEMPRRRGLGEEEPALA
jgi:hypothetical protein